MPMPEMRDYTQPDFSAAALVIVDTQAGTLDGRPFEIPGTKTVLPVIGRLSAAFRKASRPIVHIVRIYQSDGRNVDLCRRAAVESGVELVIEDSPDCQIAPGLLPPGARPLDCALLLEGGIQEISAHEVVIYKPRWGAFYKTPLRSHLSSNAVSTLVFAGHSGRHTALGSDCRPVYRRKSRNRHGRAFLAAVQGGRAAGV